MKIQELTSTVYFRVECHSTASAMGHHDKKHIKQIMSKALLSPFALL